MLRMIKEILVDLFVVLRFPFYLVGSSWQLFLQWTSASSIAIWTSLRIVKRLISATVSLASFLSKDKKYDSRS